jgi:hypothetical protein
MLESRQGFRDLSLRALVLFGVSLVVITELLSYFGLLRRIPLIASWLAILAAAMFFIRIKRFRPALDPFVLFCVASIAVILTLTAITAGFSPPNSADAMAYHLPRVIYWAEQSSVRFFPTPYFNQVMLQPLAEYMMLHTYVLTGGDYFINFVQWFASLATIAGVSSVARLFGSSNAGQAFAALFCATIPGGILASSGAKNDYWLAMWLIAAVYFALCLTKSHNRADALLLGAAIGLALLTKATAYLFLPWPLAAISLTGRPWRRRFRLRTMLLSATLIVIPALALNAPQYIRNFSLSGSPMGFDSAQGDGFFRWRNETFGWKQTASNVLRNLSEQLGGRDSAWNRGVYDLVVKSHQFLGIDVNDPSTTWRWSVFAPPINANHEANAPNTWHLVILLAIACALLVQTLRCREREPSLYALALLFAFAAFCACLKWQPFLSRLLLPLFVLAAPLTGMIGELGRKRLIPLAFALFLLSNARLSLLENWVRPLKGPKSVLHTPREAQYFADMGQWNNRATYQKAVDLLAYSNCHTVGIDITNLTLEYPLQALLRDRKPAVTFLHAGVQNVSSRYAPPVAAPACAVACLDCAGDAKRLALYNAFPVSVPIDKFVIFLHR